MATDLYFTEDGDIARGPEGDLAVTQTPWRDTAQQAYIRVMTDIGDYVLYPTMGADLSQLYGLPQAQSTGDLGVDLITAALNREGMFTGRNVTVKAVPVSLQTIRFDISIFSSSQQLVKLSVKQSIGAT